MATSTNRLIVDCDVGLDDAQALIMALGRRDVNIEAITAVGGNTNVDQVCKNIRKVLKICDRLSIPTYKGCNEPLIGNDHKLPEYQGADGLGDVIDDDIISDDVIQDQHAVTYLIEAAAKEPNTLTLVCLGPLTNVAAALKLDANFGKNLRACHIMGGNYSARGNVTPAAEYNFYFDPEAAHIVLRGMKCPVTTTGWEVCLDHPLTWDQYEAMYAGEGRTRKFIRIHEANGVKWMKEQSHDYVFADQFAMAVAIDKTVITKSFRAKACVELHGRNTRGQMIVERNVEDCNAEVVVGVDMDKVVRMMNEAMDKLDV